MRLDHLLSKEHTPVVSSVPGVCRCREVGAMVVFTSGIIDIPLPVARAWRCRRLPVLLRLGGVGAHCWGSEESGGLPCVGGVWGFGSTNPADLGPS